MKEAPSLPPLEALIDLQAELIAEHGGAQGLRDRGTLEASLARPRQILAYAEGHITVFDLAAPISFGITRNHPFIDGNKRIAFAALGMTLGLNGFYLDVSEREATRITMAVASGEMAEDAFRDWVVSNSFEG